MTPKEKHFGQPADSCEREELRGAVVRRFWMSADELHIEFADGRSLRVHPALRGTADQYLYFQFWDAEGGFIEV